MVSRNERDFDVVLFGATSSVGVEIVKLLAAQDRYTWAIAGRRAAALKKIAASAVKISSSEGNVPIIVADVKDPASLRAMCAQTKVLLTTVGPYARFGEAVVEACIAAKTDYADITGEVPWVNEMKEKHGGAAIKAGCRMLSFCGYDSLPAELGTYLASKELRSNGGPALVESFHAVSGGFPDGTVETIIMQMETAFKSLKQGKLPSPPTAFKASGTGLVPTSEGSSLARSMPSAFNVIQWSSQARTFSPIHFMAPINTPVVHSSAAANGYGGLRYNERLTIAGLWLHRSPLTLFGLIPTLFTLLSFAFLGFCAVIGILRPTAKVINFFSAIQAPITDVTVLATSKDKKAKATVTMKYPGDPGILFTAVTSLAIAFELADNEDAPAGISTPTVTLGDSLAPCLKRAGVAMTVKREVS